MSAAQVTAKLNTGVDMPLLGVGTWAESDRHLFQDSIQYAIEEAGYRHIDTARYYRCEADIGIALKRVFDNGKIKREDVFITTKVWPSSWNSVEESLDGSLKDLGLDYVDLLLVHWPLGVKSRNEQDFLPKDDQGNVIMDPEASFAKFWANMEKVYLNTKKVKAIGVSNVSVKYFEDLFSQGVKVVPAVNQVENHPYLPQDDLVQYCKSKGIVVTAYSPFGSAGTPILKDKLVQELAGKYNCGPGSIAINFQLKRGICVIPKSFNPKRLHDNAQLVDLSAEDVQALLDVKKGNPERMVLYSWGHILGFDDWTEPRAAFDDNIQ